MLTKLNTHYAYLVKTELMRRCFLFMTRGVIAQKSSVFVLFVDNILSFCFKILKPPV